MTEPDEAERERAQRLYQQNFNPVQINTDKPLPAPGVSLILEYFEYRHLPDHLQGVSRLFHTLAHELEDRLPSGAEKAVALRKLLESKDAAVRAALHGPRWTAPLDRSQQMARAFDDGPRITEVELP